MAIMKLKIITPTKIVIEQEVDEVTVPSADGELTILPKHTSLFSLLVEGIIRIKQRDKEDNFAIGGGYLETDGESVTILVSRAYHQDEVDEKLTTEALEQAKKTLVHSKDQKERAEAQSILRRSIINLKLIKRRKHHGIDYR